MTKRDYVDFQARNEPIGFLITFRTYGSWLHGDERGSVDRNHRRYGTPSLPSSSQRHNRNRGLLKQPPVLLDARRRKVTEASIRQTCKFRKWQLWALNVRTNHVHAVLTCNKKPDTALSALKANATRAMRETGCWSNDLTPWAQGGSTKHLWSEAELSGAVAYFEDDQGVPLT